MDFPPNKFTDVAYFIEILTNKEQAILDYTKPVKILDFKRDTLKFGSYHEQIRHEYKTKIDPNVNFEQLKIQDMPPIILDEDAINLFLFYQIGLRKEYKMSDSKLFLDLTMIPKTLLDEYVPWRAKHELHVIHEKLTNIETMDGYCSVCLYSIPEFLYLNTMAALIFLQTDDSNLTMVAYHMSDYIKLLAMMKCSNLTYNDVKQFPWRMFRILSRMCIIPDPRLNKILDCYVYEQNYGDSSAQAETKDIPHFLPFSPGIFNHYPAKSIFELQHCSHCKLIIVCILNAIEYYQGAFNSDKLVVTLKDKKLHGDKLDLHFTTNDACCNKEVDNFDMESFRIEARVLRSTYMLDREALSKSDKKYIFWDTNLPQTKFVRTFQTDKEKILYNMAPPDMKRSLKHNPMCEPSELLDNLIQIRNSNPIPDFTEVPMEDIVASLNYAASNIASGAINFGLLPGMLMPPLPPAIMPPVGSGFPAAIPMPLPPRVLNPASLSGMPPPFSVPSNLAPQRWDRTEGRTLRDLDNTMPTGIGPDGENYMNTPLDMTNTGPIITEIP